MDRVPETPRFRVDVRQLEDGSFLQLQGELDIASAQTLSQQVDQVLNSADGDRLVIDLRGVSFIDSTGLRALVSAEKQVREKGGRLSLVQGPDHVRRVFELVQLDRHFTFTDPPEVAGQV